MKTDIELCKAAMAMLVSTLEEANAENGRYSHIQACFKKLMRTEITSCAGADLIPTAQSICSLAATFHYAMAGKAASGLSLEMSTLVNYALAVNTAELLYQGKIKTIRPLTTELIEQLQQQTAWENQQ